MSEEALKLPKNYKRPSLEEFVAANYEADNYESFFANYEKRLSEAYASGELTDELFDAGMAKRGEKSSLGAPGVLFVQSRVRHVSTRTLRARQPIRHRFKQYLFGDPSKRLVRHRALRITGAEFEAGLKELADKEAAGILIVTTPDGRQVNLQAALQGKLELGPDRAPAPLPNPPLDSIANDKPSGWHIPMYVDGAGSPDDPAAQRAVASMMDEKRREAERRGALPVAEGAPAGEDGDPAEARAVQHASTEAPPDPAAMGNEPAPGEAATNEVVVEQTGEPGAVEGEAPPPASVPLASEATTPEIPPLASETADPADPADPAAQRAAEPRDSSKKGKKHR